MKHSNWPPVILTAITLHYTYVAIRYLHGGGLTLMMIAILGWAATCWIHFDSNTHNDK